MNAHGAEGRGVDRLLWQNPRLPYGDAGWVGADTGYGADGAHFCLATLGASKGFTYEKVDQKKRL